MVKRVSFAIAALATCASQYAMAQEPMPIQRINAAIVLDGWSDEPVWGRIEPLPLVMHEPVFGIEPTDRSEIRVGYDDQYIYASGRFFVDDPADIQSSTLTRDRMGADDVFRLLLDTFGDSENAVVFATNPAGVRTDFAIGADGELMNLDWNTFWDVATVQDDEGWYAEMRIPLSSLRFQAENGRVVMGLIVMRFSAKKNETSTFPSVSPSFAQATQRPSIAQKVVFEGISSRRPLYVTPYVLGGGSSISQLNETNSAFTGITDETVEVGLDVKYGVSSSFTLDLTANTDFAQVEADDEQFNLGRFSLFFPEKRQFFQERSGIFRTPTGALVDPSLFFHSRRIGLTDDGLPLRIYGGARLVGRAGQWDVGLVDLHVDAAQPGESENMGVLRLRRKVLNAESNIGAIVTSRIGVSGERNLAYMLDSRIRFAANDYVILQLARSFDDDPTAGIDGGMGRIVFQRPGTLFSKGLAYTVAAKWSGPRFAPALGFQPRSDFNHMIGNVRYGFYPGEGSIFRSIQPSAIVSLFRRNEDNSLQTSMVAQFLNFSLKTGLSGYVGVTNVTEDLRQELAFSSDAHVPAGRHTFTVGEMSIMPPPGNSLGVGGGVSVGEFFDGTRFSARISPTWNVSEHLEVGAEYQVDRIQFSRRGQELDADIARLHVRAAVDTHFSLSVFVQYNQGADVVATNVRIRYHFSEGRDLFVVYNERMNTDRDRFALQLPVSQSRVLLIKYAYTFTR